MSALGDVSFGAIGSKVTMVSMLGSVTFEGALGLGSWSHTSSFGGVFGGVFGLSQSYLSVTSRTVGQKCEVRWDKVLTRFYGALGVSSTSSYY